MYSTKQHRHVKTKDQTKTHKLKNNLELVTVFVCPWTTIWALLFDVHLKWAGTNAWDEHKMLKEGVNCYRPTPALNP